MTPLVLHPPSSVAVISVIQVIANRGAGTAANPIRNVTQYWSLEGQLLAENDPTQPAHTTPTQEQPSAAG